MVQTVYIQRPSIGEFKPIGGGKRVLTHEVRTASGIYHAPYIEGIHHVEQFIAANPDLRGFVPSSPDIHCLYLTLNPDDIFWAGTGTLVLRRDRNGYADERVKDSEGRPLRLPNTSIAHHGMHWKTTGPNSIMITEPSKLLPYTEIDSVTRHERYRVAGYDEVRGVVTRFNPKDKPVAEYHNASAWVNPDILLAPLGRAGWGSDSSKKLFLSGLNQSVRNLNWRFPIGSLAD